MQQPRPVVVTDPPLNFPSFWNLLGKLALKLMQQRAHGEIVITLHEGTIPIIRVNRTYKPQSLPDV